MLIILPPLLTFNMLSTFVESSCSLVGEVTFACLKHLADITENLLLSGIVLITEFLVNILIGVMSYSRSPKAVSQLQQSFLPRA